MPKNRPRLNWSRPLPDPDHPPGLDARQARQRANAHEAFAAGSPAETDLASRRRTARGGRQRRRPKGHRDGACPGAHTRGDRMAAEVKPRRFPPPGTVEETQACFVVKGLRRPKAGLRRRQRRKSCRAYCTVRVQLLCA
jgi:hypothetical protein